MQRTPRLTLSTPDRAAAPGPHAAPGPRHVAVIMDGNGRWATARGRSRTVGHLAGVRAVRRAVDAALAHGIPTLTLFAFSGDNWRRPTAEVSALMRLFRRYLATETARCVAHGVRLAVIGRRDRLDPALRRAIDAAEQATDGGTRLHLRIAVDYSARDTIARAAALWRAAPDGPPAPDAFAAHLARAMHAPDAVPDVDLLVRTGGERRLSDFLLWECAYAELWFTPVMWPDFDAAELARALDDFATRERRFGALPAAAERLPAPPPRRAGRLAVRRG
jgi:undecaprenyl diphosphate synthase